MNQKLNLPGLLFGLVFSVVGFSQITVFNSLDYGIDNPSTASISFFPEDEKIAEFISRSSQFDQLSRIQIKRYTNSTQSRLVLATISTYDNLELLNLQLVDFSEIPPYLDQFEGLKTLRITAAQWQSAPNDPVRVIVTNGNENLILEVLADEVTALDYMDRFFEVYPHMVQNIESFNHYPLRADLDRVESVYQTFDPLLLPKSSIAMISPLTEARIVTREGSMLTIPPSAFVDASGNVVTDSVQIDFTFFRDQIDIALARIGMNTEVDGVPELLQSAGMFEIQASKDGEFLQLAEGKTIEVELVSTDEGAYNIYTFDDDQGDWDEVVSDNLPADGGNDFTTAFQKFNDLYNGFSTTREPTKTSSANADLFASNAYIRFDKRSDSYWDEFDIHDPEQSQNLARAYRRSAKTRKSTLPFLVVTRHPAKDRVLREHYFFKVGEINRAIPELRDLKRYTWYTENPISSDRFRKKFVRGKSYVDFRLGYDANAEVFEFVFKDVAGQFDTLRALPYLGSKKTLSAKAMMHQDILSRYNDQFADVKKKQNKVDELQERKYTRAFQARLTSQTKKEQRAWESVKPLMTTAEREMSFEQWYAYFDNLRKLQDQVILAQNTNAFGILRVLTLDEMGYWNVDKPILKQKRFENVNVLAHRSKEEDYDVAAIFLAFNTSLYTGSVSKIDRKGGCSYLLIKGDEISWIPASESSETEDDLVTKNPFVPIASVDIDELRAKLLTN